MKVKLSLIDTNPDQPRKHFAGLEELAVSIKDKGLLQPITVRPKGDRYEIVLGERRFRAAILAGLEEIEAIMSELCPQEAFEAALVENVQREDLSPMEEAEAFAQLQARGYTQEEIGRVIGKGQSYVAHKLRLLKMPEPLTFYLKAQALSENHIRQVAKTKSVYPPGLLRSFSPGMSAKAIKGEEEASFFLSQIRPEGRLVFLEAGPVELEACRLFVDYVSKHNARIPQWEVASFWWASMASILSLSVAGLTTGLNAWAERYHDALAVWYVYKVLTPESNPEEYWGFWEDLRHSGSLSLSLEDYPLEWRESLLCRLIAQGGYCLPSRMQTVGDVVDRCGVD